LGFLNPLNACVHQRDPGRAPSYVKWRRLSHHACLCDALFCRYAIARKNTKNKKLSKDKKTVSRYISHMRGGALIQPIAMEVCTSI
jgi:hypothetical protein